MAAADILYWVFGDLIYSAAQYKFFRVIERKELILMLTLITTNVNLSRFKMAVVAILNYFSGD